MLKLAVAMLKLFLNRLNGLRHSLCWGNVVGSRVDCDTLSLHQNFPCEWMDPIDLFDLIAEKLNSGRFLIVNSDHLNGVAFHPEVSSHKFDVIALVLNRHQSANQLIAVNSLSNLKRQRLR